MKNLQLVKSENFGTVQCDFWQNEQGDILMTREQIGRALEYADPDKAIANIHDRNRDRLDKFSTTLNLRKVEGNRVVSRDVTVYTAKGKDLTDLNNIKDIEFWRRWVNDLYTKTTSKGKEHLIDALYFGKWIK